MKKANSIAFHVLRIPEYYIGVQFILFMHLI